MGIQMTVKTSGQAAIAEPAGGTKRRGFASCHRAAAVVAALGAFLVAPAAAGAVSIGEGELPGLAVDGAGTAYIAWDGPLGSASLEFCRLPRGAAACDVRHPITAAGATIRRPFVTVSGSRVIILQYRYPLTGAEPAAGLFRFTSTDGGATFGPAERVGTLDLADGVVGHGDTVSGVTDASAQGGAFQNVVLSGAPAGAVPFTPLWGGDHAYGGSVGLIDAATPLVIYANLSGAAQFRRYSGSGSLDNQASWTPAVDIGGTVSYPKLASGPSGLFLLTTNPDKTLVSRKFDGANFGAEVPISAGANASSMHAFQDAAGRLHVVFERAEPQGRRLIHAVSDDGTTWRSGTVTATAEPQDSFEQTRVATAPDHIGVVVWKGLSAVGGASDIRVAAVGPDAPVDLAPDTTPPQTKIKKHPRKVVKTKHAKAKVKFTFKSSEPGSTFECKLDKKKFKSCKSPKKLKVKVGKHRFQVRATDAAGNTDPSPATRKFKVVRKRGR
jgi:hypothetical protein